MRCVSARRQPRDVVLVVAQDRAAVCFRMMGVPFKRAKFERQAERLTLRESEELLEAESCVACDPAQFRSAESSSIVVRERELPVLRRCGRRDETLAAEQARSLRAQGPAGPFEQAGRPSGLHRHLNDRRPPLNGRSFTVRRERSEVELES